MNKDKVNIEDLTPEQEEEVYRKVEMKYLISDANRHINDMIEQLEDSDGDEDIRTREKLEALDEDDKESLAEEYKDDHDCNINDNSQWENLIRKYIE